ncbi:efflux RND transporter periplasmic adaptor subunit [Vibrio astriarenae]|uniref:efflux RND transporter periplasmic adaptor subunit n=1 Tax=Vibrio astriarenae TaxID=1481923 RepID=UPI003735A508
MRSSVYRYLLTGSASLLLTACNQADERALEKPNRPVQVHAIEKSTGTALRNFVGIIESQKEASLSFRVPGTIESIHVSMGDTVEKGQVIAQLDPHDYQVNIAELEARLLEALSSERLAKIELDRVLTAQSADAIAEVNIDRAKSALERASAGVQVIERNIQKARDALSYTKLQAPFSGVIAARLQKEFEQASPGVPVLKLHQPKQLQVTIDVPESMISDITRHQGAMVWHKRHQINVPALVTEIGTQPDHLKRTFPVKLTIESDYDELMSGQSVDVQLFAPLAAETVCLPYSAITDNSGVPSVMIAQEEVAHLVTVEHIEMRAKQACVIADLSIGDKVVVSGVDYLTEGQSLRILEERVQ